MMSINDASVTEGNSGPATLGFTVSLAGDAVNVPFSVNYNTADDTAEAWCPYCGEPCELALDPGGGAHQEYVEDCPVCCRPWRVTADWIDGVASVRLETEDE